MTITNGIIERDFGAPNFRLLHIATGAQVTLIDVTLRRGQATNPAGDARGGGIYNLGSLYLNGCNLNENSAQGGPPIISFGGFATDSYGGAIYAVAPIDQIADTTFNNNSSLGGNGSTLDGGGSPGGLAYGGAISLNNVFINSINNSIFTNNLAQGGGTAFALDLLYNGGNAYGGAIYHLASTTNDLSNNTFDHNVARGGSHFSPNAFDGAGLGGAVYVVGSIEITSTMYISTSTFSNNTTEGANSQLAESGGAGLAVNRSTIEVRNSTFSGNSSVREAGGIRVSFPVSAKFIGNTITENTSGDFGGGFYLDFASTVGDFLSNIVANNTNIRSSEGADIYEVIPDQALVFTNADYNLIGIAGAGSGHTIIGGNNITGTVEAPLDPGLLPLANNGGITLTHKILPTSQALNNGLNPDPKAFTDQRNLGYEREAPVNEPDIGAFELQCDELEDLRPAVVKKRRGGGGGGRVYSVPLLPAAMPVVEIDETVIETPVVEVKQETAIMPEEKEEPIAQGCSGSEANPLGFLLALVLLFRRKNSRKS